MAASRSTDDLERHSLKLRCPKDAQLMEKVTVGAMVIDRCARCGSIWLDSFELERLLAVQGAAARVDVGAVRGMTPGNTIGAVACPRDGASMHEVADPVQAHVRMHTCRVCNGKLLDAGELKDLSELTLLERLRSFVG
ncbi:MAG: zf-TFIIB domain-containing protein [Phycisphaerales bacterium]